jgi:hypothetical protein
MEGGDIARDLRSLAYDVGKRWNAELDRRNAEWIERMKSWTSGTAA